MNIKTKSTICALIGLSLLTGCKTSQKVAVKEKPLVILFDNDVHCAIEHYSKIAGLRDAIADTTEVALVSSGDFLQGGTLGAISRGQYVIDVMLPAGYDAITLGNHEFDYKVPRMKELLSQLNAPIVCANLRDTKTGEALYPAYTMKQMGKHKVAFVGATTPTTRNSEEYAFVDDNYQEIYNLQPDKLPQLIQQAVDDARKAGAKYVVLLSHLGEDKTEYNSDSHTIIRKTSGIDAVLDGHTHSVIAQDTVHNKAGKPVVIAQTGTKFANIGKLTIDRNGKSSTQLIATSQVKEVSAKVKEAYDQTLSKSQSYTNRKIGYSDVDLEVMDKNGFYAIRVRETNAGDLVADAIRSHSGTEIAMMNAGGIRTSVSGGEMTFGKVMDLVPYDNILYVVKEKGEVIVDLLTSCIQQLPETSGDFPQVSGLKYEIDAKNHTVSNVMVKDRQTDKYYPIDPKKTYTISTLDYTVTGGGFNGKLRNSTIVRKEPITLSEMVSNFIEKDLKGKIGSEYKEPQGRITFK